LRFENGHGPALRADQAKHRVDTTLEATRSSNSCLHPGAELPVIMSSPAFQGRAHVDLKRPGFVVVPVEKSVALDDTLYIDHSVLAGVSVREAFAYLFTIDGTVDDDMADMDALRAVFFRHRLGEGTETALAELKAPYPARPRSEALAPVNKMVPRFRGTMRRRASRPNRNPP
jgi:hypothetical protein